MTHLFRPADTPDAPYSPSWKRWRGLLYVELNRWLAPLARWIGSGRARAVAGPFLLCLALLVQVVLVLVVGYLIDLSISLMDLWVELARKHMELTL